MAGRRSVTAARWISPLVVDGSGDAAVRIGGTEGCCSGSREPPPRGTISTSLGRRAGARGAGVGRCSPCPSPMSCWWAVSHTWHGHFRPRNRPEHAGHRPRLVGWCAASSARQLATVHRSWLRAVDADTAPPTWTAMSSSAVSRSSTARREARSTPVTSSGLVCSTTLPRSSYSISPIHHSRYLRGEPLLRRSRDLRWCRLPSRGTINGMAPGVALVQRLHVDLLRVVSSSCRGDH